MKTIANPLLLAIVIGLAWVNSELVFAQGQYQTIVKPGDSANGDGFFSKLDLSRLNENGQIAFEAFGITGSSAGTLDDNAIFFHNGTNLIEIAREGDQISNGNLGSFNRLVLNDSGQLAFRSFGMTGTSGGINEDEGIFFHNGNNLVEIAREGGLTANGNFGFLDNVQLNESGQIVFESGLMTGTNGGTTDDNALFFHNGNNLVEIAREGDATANGNLGEFLETQLNDFGQIVFQSTGMTGTNAGIGDDMGIFFHNGNNLIEIAREGDATSDGNFTNEIGNIQLNNSGQIAFRGAMSGTSNGAANDNGLFLYNGTNLVEVAREGDATANGQLGNITGLDFNESGQIAFLSSSMAGTSGGSTDDNGVFLHDGSNLIEIAREGDVATNGILEHEFHGISLNNSGQVAFLNSNTAGSNQALFIGDGIELVEIRRQGDIVNGQTILGFQNPIAINDFGQVVVHSFNAASEGTIELFTPDLRWRNATSGNWGDNGSNWTLTINPAHVHDVFIDPDASLTVFGPTTNASVKSLQVGGGSGLATLALQNGATLTAINGVAIESTGTLTGDGSIAGNILNNGTVIAQNVTVDGVLANNRNIQGNGRIHANIVNNTNGRIRALNGNTMWLSGPSFTNQGLVEVHDSELRVDAAIMNQSGTGLISVRDGSLIADGGIINSGSIAMTFGNSIIQGDINNTGVIQVSGGAHATFFDDITQNGTFQVSAVGNTSSTAVIIGEFSGSGGFVGGGDVFALGDLRPGNSPASVLMDGNLFLGNETDTYIELGGLGVGEFDQFIVTGDFNLAGELFVSLLDDHTLAADQEYLIADIFGDLFGQFAGLEEGDLVGTFGGRQLFISYTAGDGNDIGLFTAIPEPGSTSLLIALATSLLLRRRRRH